MTDSEDYPSQWHRGRRWVRTYWISVAILVVIVSAMGLGFVPPNTLVPIFFLPIVIIAAIKAFAFRCPRCGKFYFWGMSLIVVGPGLSKTCAKCGLGWGEDPGGEEPSDENDGDEE